MNYKGAYASGTSYSVGDVVVYTDNVAYWLQKPAVAGTPCHDTLFWGRCDDEIQDTVLMFHSILSGISSDIADINTAIANIPTNINDEAITLKDESDNEYLITVDASGDTPELAVTLIEEESEGEGD